MEFTITSGQITGFLSLVALIWGFWKIIKEAKKPNDDLKKEVQHHTVLLNNDNERLRSMEESNKMILQCLLVILNHDITGNGIEKMKESRDELETYLVNK